MPDKGTDLWLGRDASNPVPSLPSVCASLILIVHSACDHISEAPWGPLEKVFLVSGAKALIVHQELRLPVSGDCLGWISSHSPAWSAPDAEVAVVSKNSP